MSPVDSKLGSNWFWDVNLSHGRNKADQTMLGNIDASKLRQPVGPLAQCTAPCAPFNFFGGQGSITQVMLDFVTFEQNDSSEQSQFNTTANLSGTLLQLPGGPLGLAVGLEYRKLKGRFDPDPIVAAGFSSDIPAQPTRGGYNVKEAFAELNAPLLSGMTLIDLLELNGAVRVSDYSALGSTTTYRAGINWKPFCNLRLRGSWAQVFRWNTTFLRRYDVFVQGPNGTQVLERVGTQVGSPAQGFPRRKSVAAIDRDPGGVGESLTGRYVSKLREPTGVLKSVFYTDLQMRLSDLDFLRGLRFAFGVNNLFDVETPGCVSCESNNFSQAIRDIPGRYYYARASFKM